MTHCEQHKNRILRVLAVLLVLAVVALCAIGGSIARYRSSASGASSATVALWGSTQTVTLPDDAITSLVPGSSITYNLTVTNQSGGKTSEVSQTYYIQVETAGNLPLQFELQREGEGTALTKTSNNTWQADTMQFAAGKAGEQTYILTVKWPDNQNSASLAGVPDYVQINVCAQQAD